jgi:hypothetical protein
MHRDKLYYEILQLNTDSETSPLTKAGGRSKTKIDARILWPALGFPAVISPNPNSKSSPIMDGDASKCICVLLLSNQKYLSKEEAAGYLRYVPWEDRNRRHIATGETGSFAETDLEVRNDLSRPFARHGWKDLHGTGICFGGVGDSSKNGITVKLADYVRKFYDKNGMKYLHEIRIFEDVSAKLKEGQYNLFWNSESLNENAPSVEMKLLLDRYAKPKRENSEFWDAHSKFLLGEYEYEYGDLHKPYRSELQMRLNRTEVLHPLFVKQSTTSGIKVGHITDTHVSVREDVYEENLKKESTNAQFNNWNKSFVKAYDNAKKTSDILLLTGDLVDYGRGHWGLTAKDRLGEDGLYHTDRNWFLFYYLLASGDAYKKPSYTILGNHDWRLNPYPPIALAGAPSPSTFFHNHIELNKNVKPKEKKETERLLRAIHGKGDERKFTYYLETDRDFIKKFWDDGSLLKTVGKLLAQKKTLDEPHLPTETTVESIGWYLMVINPFLDYSFSLPTGQKILMLDWAEDEDLLFPITADGKEWPHLPWEIDGATLPGPKARNSLTSLQKKLIEDFVEGKGNSKLIGIHAPLISPYPDWSDADLMKGIKIYGSTEKSRGPQKLKIKKSDGRVENGHPIFAILPDENSYGTVADYNSISIDRDWFIKKLADPKSGVRAIFAGHIHRNGLYAVHTVLQNDKLMKYLKGDYIKGKMIVKGLFPPSTSLQGSAIGLKGLPYSYPLYINTTSAGPRGNYKGQPRRAKNGDEIKGLNIDPGYALVDISKNGAIDRVEFLSTEIPQIDPKMTMQIDPKKAMQMALRTH